MGVQATSANISIPINCGQRLVVPLLNGLGVSCGQNLLPRSNSVFVLFFDPLSGLVVGIVKAAMLNHRLAYLVTHLLFGFCHTCTKCQKAYVKE